MVGHKQTKNSARTLTLKDLSAPKVAPTAGWFDHYMLISMSCDRERGTNILIMETANEEKNVPGPLVVLT